MKEETMKKGSIIALVVVGVLVILGLIFMSSIISMRNSLIALDEDVNKAWAQVQNVYQRRADLIPNLVQTVKGYASHERETLQAVTEARAKLGGVTNISGKDLTPENVAKFQQLQSGGTKTFQ